MTYYKEYKELKEWDKMQVFDNLIHDLTKNDPYLEILDIHVPTGQIIAKDHYNGKAILYIIHDLVSEQTFITNINDYIKEYEYYLYKDIETLEHTKAINEYTNNIVKHLAQ